MSSPGKLSSLKRILFSLLMFTFLVAVIEGSFVLLYRLKTGSFSSVTTKLKEERNAFTRAALKGKTDYRCAYVDSLFPHPYLAYVAHGNPPCGELFVNKLGFKGRLFPYEKSKKDFVILLTGGSVAHQLSHYGDNNDNYVEVLLNKYFVNPKGGKFIVLNGGQGAWKHPQPSILFLLLWQNLDAVITLDGYNESDYIESYVHFDAPPEHFMVVNPALSSSTRELFRIRLNSMLVEWTKKNAFVSRSHFLYWISKSLRRIMNQRLRSKKSEGIRLSHKRGYGKDADTLPKTKGKKLPPKTTVASLYEWPKKWDLKKQTAANIRKYKGYLRAIHTLATSKGIKNAHFFQPVAGYAKPLTKVELRLVPDPKEYVPRYRRIIGKMMTLKKEKIPVFNLLRIFENEKKQIYSDHVHCLYTFNEKKPAPPPFSKERYSRGYAIMGAEIVKRIGKLWGLKQLKPLPRFLLTASSHAQNPSTPPTPPKPTARPTTR